MAGPRPGIEEKVLEYEIFLNERLRKDLGLLIKQRDRLFEDIGEYQRLSVVIETILKSPSSNGGKLKTQVDIGCHFFCQARVPDSSRIFVDVGYGFHVEFTLAEALEFIEDKCSHLKRRSEALTQKITE